MRRKEQLQPSESLEERRIACHEEFQSAIRDGNLPEMIAAIEGYSNCKPDHYSFLSLVKEGFNFVTESCQKNHGVPYPTSWKDWQFDYPLIETIGAINRLFSLTTGRFDYSYNKNSSVEDQAYRDLLNYMSPYFCRLLEITDAGEFFISGGSRGTVERDNIKTRGGYNQERDIFEAIVKFERNFLESARKTLASEKQKSIEDGRIGNLWLVASKYLQLGTAYDRDCAWLCLEEGLKLAQAKLLNPNEAVKVFLNSFWFLITSTEFDYGEKGDFTLFEEAKSLVESGLAIVSLDSLGEEAKEELKKVEVILKALMLTSSSKRISEGTCQIVKKLEGFVSNSQEVSGRPISSKTTLLGRLTGRLTKVMGNKEEAKQPVTLEVGSNLRFIDGSSAKVLSVFNGGETVVYQVENNVGRICAARAYHGEQRGKDFGIERGRFVNDLRDLVSGETRSSIPEVYDYKIAKDGTVYVLQEFIDGENLQTLPKPLAEERIAAIANSSLKILAEIHRLGRTHLDVKPGNLIRAENGRIVLVDWDLARKFEEKCPKGGTPGYISPEVCLGSGKVDGSADIYSFGVTLYEFWTGEVQATQIVGSSEQPIFKGSFDQRFPKINEVPEKWREIIEMCTRIDPSLRPTAKELQLKLS